MTSLASYTPTASASVQREGSFGKDQSFNYLLAFTALGVFVSLMAVALGFDGLATAAW